MRAGEPGLSTGSHDLAAVEVTIVGGSASTETMTIIISQFNKKGVTPKNYPHIVWKTGYCIE